MNVSAVDKASGSSGQITITNDQSRLSSDEVDKMVRDAERFAEEDKKALQKIALKNEIEEYVYNLKQAVLDDEVKKRY